MQSRDYRPRSVTARRRPVVPEVNAGLAAADACQVRSRPAPRARSVVSLSSPFTFPQKSLIFSTQATALEGPRVVGGGGQRPMRIGLLGSLQVVGDSGVIAVTAARHRALLAAL